MKLKSAPSFTIDRWPPWQQQPAEVVDATRQRYTSVDHVETVWTNTLYVVLICRPRSTPWGICTPVMVRNREGMPVRSWAYLQRIKDELLGKERWAFEVYPPASQLKDEAHLTHLWVFDAGTFPSAINLQNWYQ